MPCCGMRRGWRAVRTVSDEGHHHVQRAFRVIGDLSTIIIAAYGLWFFWSQYSYLSGLSWWYAGVQLGTKGGGPKPDYDLTAFPWQLAGARVFEVGQGRIAMVTSEDPFGYQAFATVSAGGAGAAEFQFDVEIEQGGVTIGLLQGGKWIAANSSRSPGPFADWNSAQLGHRRSLTVVVANDNPAGESRVTINALRLFLRK
jgi:hypothetical protein